MGFSRQESGSGLPFSSPRDLPNPGIEPRSPTLQADTLLSEPPGKLTNYPKIIWNSNQMDLLLSTTPVVPLWWLILYIKKHELCSVWICCSVAKSYLTQWTWIWTKGFPGGSDSKVSACNAGDQGSIPGLGRSSGEGNGNPLWCSFLPGKSHGRGDWQAAVHGVPKEWDTT